jgi:hypothetical protein
MDEKWSAGNHLGRRFFSFRSYSNVELRGVIASALPPRTMISAGLGWLRNSIGLADRP